MKPASLASGRTAVQSPGMDYHTTSDPRAFIAAELQRHRDARRVPAFSLLRVVAALHRGTELGASEREACRDAEIAAGKRSLGAAAVPWSALSARTMDGTTGSKGGYLSGVELQPLHDALRADSAIIAAGATIFDGLVGSATQIPRVSAKSSPQWLAPGAAAADGGVTLGAISATPKTIIVKTSMSAQLLNVPSAEEAVRATLRRDLGEAIDAAAVNGPGGAQPLGILNSPGVASFSGTALTYATILQQIEALLTAGARRTDLFAICGATAGRILGARERAAGSGFVLDAGRLAGIACTESAHVPASTLIIGVARQLAIASWGAGVELDANQSSGFNTATVDIRVKADVDVAVLNPAAFLFAATVT